MIRFQAYRTVTRFQITYCLNVELLQAHLTSTRVASRSLVSTTRVSLPKVLRTKKIREVDLAIYS